MKTGETVCYYRARGGQKSVYITIVYENNILRESIIQHHEQQSVNQSQEGCNLAYQSTVLN